ncbi:MAG TPA: HAD-IB family phosphatase [Candidatus Binatia bacterium]|jgi:HAD superfamily phosphoserine phosphatase-like hydrolase|nr:HAD-IB family phosphatase [Candidatus Binatia bacterium]
MRKRRKVYSEDDRFLRFDGTVTLRDTTDAALEAFALPEYREWERMWEEGRITGRECMERQTRLMNACPEMLRSLCNRIPIDDGIYDLESECIRSGSLLVIVSDGIDLLMEEVLTTRGLKHLPHYSNRLDWDEERGPFLAFPYSDLNCRGGCGLCKCRLLERPGFGIAPTVYIGDGLSDICVVHRADRVFAKSRLHDYCLKSGIVHESFETLTGVALSLFR